MKLYFKYLRAYFLSIAQYKKSAVLTIIGQFFTSLFSLIGIQFLFSNFKTVAGFTFEEILLCYANIMFSFSIAEFFGRGFDTFEGIMANGQFDRMLLRPQNEIVQVLESTFEISRIGKLIQSLLIYLLIIPNSSIEWNVCRLLVLIEMLVCGVILFISLFIIYASFCFFTTQGLEIFNIFTDGSREFGKYPFAVYGENVLKIFTYVVPVACIQYYPICFLTGKSIHIADALVPLVSLPYIFLAALFWRKGVKRYKSTGS